MEEIFVQENERYDIAGAMADLMRLAGYSAPLPVIFKELYKDKRIVLYTPKGTIDIFGKMISVFGFYSDLNIVYCSDEDFLFDREKAWIPFVQLKKVKLDKNDFFFALDVECKKSLIDYVKAQGVRKVEAIRKGYMGGLVYYVTNVRPLKNLLLRYPKLQVIMTDNFSQPKAENRTEWENYLANNALTREKAKKMLENGENPYPKGLYSEKYSIQDLIDMQTAPNRVMDEKGVLVLSDYESKYVNVNNGIRKTHHQPQKYERRLHIFGGCGWYGIGHADDETVASRLQLMLNEEAKEEKILVENRGSFIWGKHDLMWYSVSDTSFGENDIIVVPENPKWARGFYMDIPNLHYADITIRLPSDGEVFNDTWHPSESGLRVYARNLFNCLKENNFFKCDEATQQEKLRLENAKQYGIPFFANSMYSQGELLSSENMSELSQYLDMIGKEKPRIGSIVMNCNPFTLGHRYLIECASRQVERLYIFAVEEDKSFFPFKDRIELIKKGTADLKNVTVLPSGKFIISALTFTDYFGKKELQDKVIDPSLDVSLFGKYIAPRLGISVRFAGEEPLDKVTLQYNDAMKRILPEYGIEFIVIPRKESGGAVISASRVRALLEKQDLKAIKKIVPKTTYKYLVGNFKNK